MSNSVEWKEDDGREVNAWIHTKMNGVCMCVHVICGICVCNSNEWKE